MHPLFLQPANFIGKAAVREILKEKPKRHLVYLTVDTSDIDPEGNETVWHNDKVMDDMKMPHLKFSPNILVSIVVK